MTINIIFIIAFFLFFTKPVLAYLDPGSGSFIFQVVVATILGGIFSLKMYFRKLKNIFLNFFGKNKNNGK